jgi:mono/diheme cytochrome c family protein
MFRCNCILCGLLGLAVAWLVLFGSAPAAHAQAPKGAVSFINDVAPILKENCFACHDAKKKKGKFEMTSYESLRKGGSKDDPIMPGKARESLIIELLQMTGTGRMPPKDAGDALPKDKIAVIARWIDQGAKLDAGVSAKADLLRELRARWQPPQPHTAYKYPVLINALAFTPDSKQLVVGGNHELTVWDVSTGKLLRRIFTRAERAHAMLFLPDGKLVVAGGRPGQEGDVRIYDIKAGKTQNFGGVPAVDGVHDKAVFVKELLQSDDSILALAVSADGKKLAAGGCDRLVRVWDLASGKLEYSIENHADWILGLGFTPDGKGLATASRDKNAKVWDLANKESVLTFPDHQNIVYAVAVTPDGKFGISAGEDGQVRVWQATDATKQVGKSVRSMNQSKPTFRLAVHGDAKKLVVASAGADNAVKLWDGSSGAALKHLTGFTDWVFAVALSPDGQLVAGGAANGEVRIAKIADGAVVAAFNATPGYVSTKTAEAPKK